MASVTDFGSKPPSGSLRVPKGFFTLMELFVRALLKNKPLDVFEYGAKFFENLLQIRTDTGHNPVVHGVQSEDGFASAGLRLHTKCGKPNCKKCKKNKHKKSTVSWSHVTLKDSESREGRRHTLEPGETSV